MCGMDGMDWVGGTACPEGLLHPVLPAAVPTDYLNAIQDYSWAELLPQRKFVGDDLVKKIRVLEISDMLLHVAAGHGHVPRHVTGVMMYSVYSLNSRIIRLSCSTENWMDLSGATTRAPFTW